MLLIAEIMLTISAWKKGWKGWALLPTAVALCLALVIGSAAGADGTSEGTLYVYCLALDLANIVALVVMTVRGPASVHQNRHADPPRETVTVE